MKNVKYFGENENVILNLLQKSGYEAKFVGGFVRDFLSGLDPSCIHDIDIATNATAEQVMNVLCNSGLKCIRVGKKYQTVTVATKYHIFEITTLRTDINCDGRHCNVKFCNSFQEDSNRRDFTINALYMDLDGKICDYHGGLKDLQEKRVKFIGDPAERIQEDYLRIFRYFRFLSKFSSDVDVDLLEVIKKNLEGIKYLSGQRILQELIRIFEFDDCISVIESMVPIFEFLFGIKTVCFSYLNKLGLFSQMSAYERFFLFLSLSDEKIENLCKKLCISNKIAKHWILISNLYQECEMKRMSHKSYLLSVSNNIRQYMLYFMIVKIYFCNGLSTDFAREFLAEMELFFLNVKEFSVSGSDLIALNKFEKYEISSLIGNAKKYWIEQNGLADKYDCMQFILKNF